jgi:hypothetical protein
VLAVSTALYVGLWPLAIVVPRDHEGDARVGLALVLAGGLVYAAVLLVVVACLLDSRQKDRPSGQPPQRPVSQLPQRPASQPPQRQAPRTPTPQRPPAQTPLRPVSGGPDGRHPSADRGQGHTAEAARSDSWPPPRRCHRGHRYTIGYVGR